MGALTEPWPFSWNSLPWRSSLALAVWLLGPWEWQGSFGCSRKSWLAFWLSCWVCGHLLGPRGPSSITPARTDGNRRKNPPNSWKGTIHHDMEGMEGNIRSQLRGGSLCTCCQSQEFATIQFKHSFFTTHGQFARKLDVALVQASRAAKAKKRPTSLEKMLVNADEASKVQSSDEGELWHQ